MKKYIMPTINVVRIQSVKVIADSLKFSADRASVNGDDYDKALSREDYAWDIWGTAVDDEE